jgi:hypothetical protein
MATYRKTAIGVGLLYIGGFVVGIGGQALLATSLGGTDPLSSVSANSMMVALGALLWLIAGIGDASHGILMYPILKQNSERIALGYLSFRLFEAAIIAVSALFILLQIPLSAEYLKVNPTDTAFFQTLNALFTQGQLYTYSMGMVTLGIAGLTLCFGYYKTNLIPWVLMVWGLLGYAVFMTGSVLEILGFNLNLMHTIPGGLWEVFIGAWLIAKGFNVSALAAMAKKIAPTE